MGARRGYRPQTGDCGTHDSISAGLPRDRIKALNAVGQTGGAFVTVSDDDILRAVPALARASGVFGEPAGAAAYAGLQRAVADGLVAADDRIVLINTGNGLKDIAGARRGSELVGTQPYTIAPSVGALDAAVQAAGLA